MPESELTFRKILCFLNGETRYALDATFGQESAECMRTSFLLPTENILTAIPCKFYKEELCGHYCRRNTFYSEADKAIVAFCPNFNAPNELLAEDDMHVFRPDLKKLLSQAAASLQIRPGVGQQFFGDTWTQGELSPSAARKYPVFFIACTKKDIVEEKVKQLQIYHKTGPMVIFSASETVLDSQLMNILRDRRCLLLNIDACLNITFSGDVSRKFEFKSIFEPLQDNSDKMANPSFGFDFPAGTGWENLLIHFQNDSEKVAFEILNTTSLHDRSEMKIGKKQWLMLQSFAEKGGILPSEHILQNDALKKQRERLNQGLKDFFRTSEDAIVLNDDQSAYRCRFKIKPAWHSTIHHVKKRV